MKDLIASFTLFIVLIITMLISTKYLGNKCGYYTDKVSYLEIVIVNKYWEDGYNKSIEFLEEWGNDSNILPAFINHTYVESITNNILKLTQYIKYKNQTDALATIQEIKFSLHMMEEIEKVNLPNIF